MVVSILLGKLQALFDPPIPALNSFKTIGFTSPNRKNQLPALRIRNSSLKITAVGIGGVVPVEDEFGNVRDSRPLKVFGEVAFDVFAGTMNQAGTLAQSVTDFLSEQTGELRKSRIQKFMAIKNETAQVIKLNSNTNFEAVLNPLIYEINYEHQPEMDEPSGIIDQVVVDIKQPINENLTIQKN